MSIENEIEENKKRIELLKLARHMLNEEYLKSRAAAYVQWSTDSDRVWKEQGIKLPFPPTPPMPSEADIVARALDLYNHINAPKSNEPETVVKPNSEPVVEPVDEPVVDPVIKDKAEAIIEPVVESNAELELVAPIVELPPVVVPNISQPITTTVSSLPVTHGAADMDVAESAIKDIFNTPATNPELVPVTPTQSQSVVPLIKGMLKKGLLPNWIKSDNEPGKIS